MLNLDLIQSFRQVWIIYPILKKTNPVFSKSFNDVFIHNPYIIYKSFSQAVTEGTFIEKGSENPSPRICSHYLRVQMTVNDTKNDTLIWKRFNRAPVYWETKWKSFYFRINSMLVIIDTDVDIWAQRSLRQSEFAINLLILRFIQTSTGQLLTRGWQSQGLWLIMYWIVCKVIFVWQAWRQPNKCSGVATTWRDGEWFHIRYAEWDPLHHTTARTSSIVSKSLKSQKTRVCQW